MNRSIQRATHIAGLSLLVATGAAFADSPDSSFMKKASEGGHFEVESSKVAVSKSANADVKTFAQQMVDDHTKAGDELSALAQQKGVKIPDEPSIGQKAKMKLVDTMSGASFDKRYAGTSVSAHEDTVALFRKEAKSGKDADVKAWATKTLPTLEHHLMMAKDLKAKTANEK